jgi:hypothetical protein
MKAKLVGKKDKIKEKRLEKRTKIQKPLYNGQKRGIL